MATDAYSSLRYNLSLARRTLTRGRVSLCLLRALSLSAAFLILSTVIVLVAGTRSAVTTFLGFVAVFGIPAWLVLTTAIAAARRPRLEAVAVISDRILPGDRNCLISALQLGGRVSHLASFYSKAIIEAIVREALELSKSLELRKLLPLRELRFWTRVFAATAIGLVAFLVLVPAALRPSFSALMLAPFQTRVPPQVQLNGAAVEPVRVPPQISELTITYDYPDYTGMERRVVRTIVGDLSAVRGTTVELQVEFTREVSSASLSFDDGRALRLERTADKHFVTNFAVMREATYRIVARDRHEGESISPSYSIQPQEDLVPFIKLVQPPPEATLDESMELPLEVMCADDYGLSSLYLHYSRDPQNVHREEIRKFSGRTTETVLTHFWDVSPLQLLPGETASYFLEVFDNDDVSGPKSSRTPVMTVRFPSMAELYASIEEQHAEQVVSLGEILGEARMLKQELDRIAMEMKQEAPVTWERKKEMEELGETSRDVMEDIGRASLALEESIQKLESYEPVNWELADRIQELAQLLREIESPELREALERFDKALSRLDKDAMAAAAEEFSLTQEELLQGLDRAIELLKQIKLDEKLRGLVEEALRLAEKETEINRGLETATPDLAKAAQEQFDVGQALKQLEERIEQVSRETTDEELSAMLREISSAAQRGRVKEMMEQSYAMLRARNTETLRRLMRDIEAELYRLADNLARAEQNFSTGQSAEVTEQVRSVMHELVGLSKAEEELSMHTGRQSSDELAVRQQTILDGTASVADRLLDIARETPFMTHRTSSELGSALREMERALRHFENRRTQEGAEAAREALRLVNGVLRSLLVAEQSMCSGQGGMGVGGGLQRIRSLTGLQQSINVSTEALHSRLDKVGRLSESDQQALARLAAQQEMVREGMEEVARAMGERRDMLGRLDEIIQEMRDVESGMKSQQLDERVLRRQNQILSRLLDAQRSVQQRDYSGKRYSRPGQDLPDRMSPPELPDDLFRQSEKLQLQSLRERSERYPNSYRELVERYLRALSRESK